MFKKLRRKLKRIWGRNGRVFLFVFGAGIIVLFSVYTAMQERMVNTINPAAYRPLLDLIGDAESNGNYNAYFSRPDNTKVKFTNMTIAEVLEWQDEFIKKGNVSSAVGKYQIINTTLSGVVDQLEINPSQRFDQQTQDRLAIALIERRGALPYVNQKISKEDFAANLAKEWAALPKVVGDKPTESYYASDGVNKSRVKVDHILEAVEKVQEEK